MAIYPTKNHSDAKNGNWIVSIVATNAISVFLIDALLPRE
jgi:hypothetical protein